MLIYLPRCNNYYPLMLIYIRLGPIRSPACMDIGLIYIHIQDQIRSYIKQYRAPIVTWVAFVTLQFDFHFCLSLFLISSLIFCNFYLQHLSIERDAVLNMQQHAAFSINLHLFKNGVWSDCDTMFKGYDNICWLL